MKRVGIILISLTLILAGCFGGNANSREYRIQDIVTTIDKHWVGFVEGVNGDMLDVSWMLTDSRTGEWEINWDEDAPPPSPISSNKVLYYGNVNSEIFEFKLGAEDFFRELGTDIRSAMEPVEEDENHPYLTDMNVNDEYTERIPGDLTLKSLLETKLYYTNIDWNGPVYLEKEPSHSSATVRTVEDGVSILMETTGQDIGSDERGYSEIWHQVRLLDGTMCWANDTDVIPYEMQYYTSTGPDYYANMFDEYTLDMYSVPIYLDGTQNFLIDIPGNVPMILKSLHETAISIRGEGDVEDSVIVWIKVEAMNPEGGDPVVGWVNGYEYTSIDITSAEVEEIWNTPYRYGPLDDFGYYEEDRPDIDYEYDPADFTFDKYGNSIRIGSKIAAPGLVDGIDLHGYVTDILEDGVVTVYIQSLSFMAKLTIIENAGIGVLQ